MTLHDVADLLTISGFSDAAAFLRSRGAETTSHYLSDLKKEDGLALSDQLFQSNPQCRIWSNEHLAWWRAGAAGYTTDELNAGVFPFQDAWKRSSHCDVTKGIVFEVFDMPEKA